VRAAFAARPPAGMPGPNLASRDASRLVPRSPQRLLSAAAQRSGRRQTLSPVKPTPRSGLSLPHSGCSFTEPPLRVRRSGPTSSAPRRTGREPVRSPTPHPGIRFSDPGRLNACNPLPAPSVRRSQRLLQPGSPWGPFDPSGSPPGPIHRSETCLRKTPDLRSLPACGSFETAADGSTFPVRCVPRGSLFRA
jgi:hypothetical protein